MRKVAVLISVLMVSVGLHAESAGDGGSRARGIEGGAQMQPEGYFLQRHQKAKKALAAAWLENQAPATYRDAIVNLAKYEVYVLAKRVVKPGDPRLVGQIAEGKSWKMRSELNYAQFAYRVFRQELENKTGYDLDPTELFRGQRFSMHKRQ